MVGRIFTLATHKADGMKLYVFSYDSGYVLTCVDRALTILRYGIETKTTVPEDITNTPDVMVAEIMPRTKR